MSSNEQSSKTKVQSSKIKEQISKGVSPTAMDLEIFSLIFDYRLQNYIFIKKGANCAFFDSKFELCSLNFGLCSLLKNEAPSSP